MCFSHCFPMQPRILAFGPMNATNAESRRGNLEKLGGYPFSHHHGSAENYSKRKETNWLEIHPFFHFHDCGRKSSWTYLLFQPAPDWVPFMACVGGSLVPHIEDAKVVNSQVIPLPSVVPLCHYDQKWDRQKTICAMKKVWLFGVYRGLYYPSIRGLQ